MARASSTRRGLAGTVAVRRCVVALGFISVFVALCITGASAASSWAVAAVVGTCCATPTGAVVVLELVPALCGLHTGGASAAQRDAMRRLRRELDALPETSHPLDA
jgi:hypothetical protein